MRRAILPVILVAFSPASCSESVAVDLGLPSGTMWSPVNIGASEPMEAGDYLTWGGLESQELYYEENDRLSAGRDTFLRYNGTDGLVRLRDDDDAASARLGSGWHIPGNADFLELFENCTYEFVRTADGMGCVKFTGGNGNSITIPADGDCFLSFKPEAAECAVLWTSDLRDPTCGYCVCLDEDGPHAGIGFPRYTGCNIRPVFRK